MPRNVEIETLSGVVEELLETLERGAEITLSRDGRPVARLIPYESALDEIDIHPGIRTSIHVWKEPSGRVHLTETKNETPEA